MKSTCNHNNLSSMNSARHLQTGCHLSCEPASSYYLRATTVDGLHIQEPKNTCRCSDPSSAQSEPNSSRTLVKNASHLLTTVASRDHALNTCIRKNFKIQVTQHRLEYYPSSSHKESVRLGSLTGRIQILTKGGTEVHRFLGFLGV